MESGDSQESALAELQFYVTSSQQFLQSLSQDSTYGMQASLLLKLCKQQPMHIAATASLIEEYQSSLRHLMELVEVQKTRLASLVTESPQKSLKSREMSYEKISEPSSHGISPPIGDATERITDLELQVQRLSDGMGRLRRSLSMSHDIIHEKQTTIDRLTEKLQSKRGAIRWGHTSDAAIQCHILGCDRETSTVKATCDAGTMIDADCLETTCEQLQSPVKTFNSKSIHLVSPLSDDSLIENIRVNSSVNRSCASGSSTREVIFSPHRDSLNDSLVQYSYADMSHSILRSSVNSSDTESRRSSKSGCDASESYDRDSVDTNTNSTNGESGLEVGSPDSLQSTTWQDDVSSTVEDSFALVQHYYE